MRAKRITPALRRNIVRRILRVASPRKVIMFGSAVTGRMTSESDIDLLVVQDSTVDPRGERVRIRKAIGNLGRPVDVFVMAAPWFEASKGVMGGLAYPADREGRILYEAG